MEQHRQSRERSDSSGIWQGFHDKSVEKKTVGSTNDAQMSGEQQFHIQVHITWIITSFHTEHPLKMDQKVRKMVQKTEIHALQFWVQSRSTPKAAQQEQPPAAFLHKRAKKTPSNTTYRAQTQ